MSSLILITVLVLGIGSLIAPLFYGDKVNTYIKKQKGKLVSSEFQKQYYGRTNNINKEIIIKYYDQHHNLRQVSLHYLGLFSNFGEDVILKYSHSSPEYAELKKEEAEHQQNELRKQKDFDNAAQKFDEFSYPIKNQEILVIKQEYQQANVGEYAYINNKPAPDGKYKIGLFTYIYIVNGRVTDIK